MRRRQRPRLLITVVHLGLPLVYLALGCNVDPANEERAGAVIQPGSDGENEGVSRTGTLSVNGEALAAPGEYELQTSCSYDRRHGSFSLGMHPRADDETGRGPATFGIRAGTTLRSSVPLEDGTYDARFEYSEASGEGTVPTFRGDARFSLKMLDETRERFPVLGIEATGEGDGIRFEVAARCQATVMG